jgi:hypothetical protein
MTIYEMLAGRTPFERSESEFSIQKQIVEGKIPPPSKYNPLIPKAFVKMIMKAIERDADKRFQTVPDMLAELENIQVNEHPVDDKTRVVFDPKTQIKTEPNKSNLKPAYLFSAIGVVIIAAIIAYFALSGDKDITTENNNDPKKNDTLAIQSVSIAALTINSEPSGAIVLLNNKQVGRTPLLLDSLKTDLYDIKVRLSGYEQWTAKDYRLFEGMNNLQVPLKPVTSYTPAATSTLVLKAEPEGTIFIGNKQVGSGKDAIRSEVTAGNHTVKFVHPQFGEKLLNVDLSPNQTKNITCYFQQKVTIQSLNKSGDSFWGNIFINGENTNRTTPADMMLGPGTYRITVRKTGFKTVENDVVLNIQPAFELKNHPLVFHFE